MLQALVTPILYSRAFGRGTLARTLQNRPWLCIFVKCLSASAPSGLLDLTWPSLTQCSLSTRLADGALLGGFLLSMPHLVKLHISGKGGAEVPSSAFATGGLRHLRILILSGCGFSLSTLANMAALPQDQGPLRLTTLEIGGSYDTNDPAPAELLAFLRRFGSTLLHLSTEAIPPHDLASTCPDLVSIRCANDQGASFLQHSLHPNLILIILYFFPDPETGVISEQPPGALWTALLLGRDRARFPRLSRLRLIRPAGLGADLNQEKLQAWDAFAAVCVESGLRFEGSDGDSWEQISSECILSFVRD